MSGSEVASAPGPEQVVEQMREATDRLREQGWMVAPPVIDMVEAERRA